MIGLLQRVTQAAISVNGETVGQIGRGILVLVGVKRGDNETRADRLLERILGYRMFPDDSGKMNLSVKDIGGDLMLVPQFTLAADTAKGMRPSFTPAASPEEGKRLFLHLVESARNQRAPVAAGIFGADMQVTLTNDGPVTFCLRI